MRKLDNTSNISRALTILCHHFNQCLKVFGLGHISFQVKEIKSKKNVFILKFFKRNYLIFRF